MRLETAPHVLHPLSTKTFFSLFVRFKSEIQPQLHQEAGDDETTEHSGHRFRINDHLSKIHMDFIPVKTSNHNKMHNREAYRKTKMMRKMFKIYDRKVTSQTPFEKTWIFVGTYLPSFASEYLCTFVYSEKVKKELLTRHFF